MTLSIRIVTHHECTLDQFKMMHRFSGYQNNVFRLALSFEVFGEIVEFTCITDEVSVRSTMNWSYKKQKPNKNEPTKIIVCLFVSEKHWTRV